MPIAGVTGVAFRGACGAAWTMIIDPLKAFLFGEVSKVDIHCGCPDVARRLRQRVSESIELDLRNDDAVRVSIKPSRDVDYALVHYTAGLLRPAHADVMVLPHG
jgi:hypothetical protein